MFWGRVYKWSTGSLVHPTEDKIPKVKCPLWTTGVADQLQTNFASDLRSILKTVFEVTSCNPMAADDSVFTSPTPSTSTSNPDPEQCAAPPSTASNSVASVRPDRGGSSSGSHRSGRAAEGSRQGAGSEGRERHRHRSNSSHRSRRSNYDGELRDNVSLRTWICMFESILHFVNHLQNHSFM